MEYRKPHANSILPVWELVEAALQGSLKLLFSCLLVLSDELHLGPVNEHTALITFLKSADPYSKKPRGALPGSHNWGLSLENLKGSQLKFVGPLGFWHLNLASEFWHLNFFASLKVWHNLVHPAQSVLMNPLPEHWLCIKLLVYYSHLMAPFDLIHTSLVIA